VIAAGEDQLSFSDLRKPLQALLATQAKSAESQWGVHDKNSIERVWESDRKKIRTV